MQPVATSLAGMQPVATSLAGMQPEVSPAVAAPALTPTPTANLTALQRIAEFASTNNINPSNKSLEQVVMKLETNGIAVPEELLQSLRRADRDKLRSKGLINYYLEPTTSATRTPRPPATTVGPTTGTGIGVHLNKLPKVIKLGHIHINPSNLYYENILSVRNPKNKPLRAYKDEHVSEYLASLLIKLIEGGNITKHEIQPLSDHEKMIYDNLIKRSKLHKMNDNTFETTAGKMRQRLEVLEGELEAGNTNPEIKGEIHGLLFKLAHAKVISQVDANKHWRDLQEMY
jgi:hypothetical protein